VIPLAFKVLLILGIVAILYRTLFFDDGRYLEMKDHAKIFYRDQGTGPTLILIHGWTCSSKFWQRNVPELSKKFRVITVDLRGHGNSSKILEGHTINQYARDIRAVIEKLDLQEVVLAGWSMGGPVVLSYYQQFSDEKRLKGLALIDTAPFPFSPEDWNRHSLKNYNTDEMNNLFETYSADPVKFATTFTTNMFKDSRASEADLSWIRAELMKTPPWIAIAVYSDFLMSDQAEVLPAINIPVIVFAADSNVYKSGIKMGRSIADMIPQAVFVSFPDAGHLLFYEQPDQFNRSLTDFIQKI
jgi:non-heme chloroperoxidase